MNKKTYLILLFVITIGFSMYTIFSKTPTNSNPVCYLNESDQIKIFGEIRTHLQSLCSEIKGTPAWIKENKIIDYGYREEWNEIPLGIFFFYKSDCSWCEKQISLFGEDYFELLKKENRAIECQ